MERDVIHSCGHVERHFVVGFSASDCEREARKLARRKCKGCYRNDQDEKARQAGLVTADLGLPSLEGSERQVAWATTIRAEKLAALLAAKVDISPTLIALTDAKWWIDRRSAKPTEIKAVT